MGLDDGAARALGRPLLLVPWRRCCAGDSHQRASSANEVALSALVGPLAPPPAKCSCARRQFHMMDARWRSLMLGARFRGFSSTPFSADCAWMESCPHAPSSAPRRYFGRRRTMRSIRAPALSANDRAAALNATCRRRRRGGARRRRWHGRRRRRSSRDAHGWMLGDGALRFDVRAAATMAALGRGVGAGGKAAGRTIQRHDVKLRWRASECQIFPARRSCKALMLLGAGRRFGRPPRRQAFARRARRRRLLRPPPDARFPFTRMPHRRGWRYTRSFHAFDDAAAGGDSRRRAVSDRFRLDLRECHRCAGHATGLRWWRILHDISLRRRRPTISYCRGGDTHELRGWRLFFLFFF